MEIPTMRNRTPPQQQMEQESSRKLIDTSAGVTFCGSPALRFPNFNYNQHEPAWRKYEA
jgi:hypothetical protein